MPAAPADGVTLRPTHGSGTALARPGAASWTVEWRAPATAAPAGPTAVVFHAAANAANDDASEFGDLIYTASATTRPAGP